MATPTEPRYQCYLPRLEKCGRGPRSGLRSRRGKPLPSRENVIAVLGAKIAAQGVRIEAEIKAQTARIDVLQRVIWRVIWPLIVLLAVPVFGLLYRVSHYRPWLRSGPLRWACFGWV